MRKEEPDDKDKKRKESNCYHTINTNSFHLVGISYLSVLITTTIITQQIINNIKNNMKQQ